MSQDLNPMFAMIGAVSPALVQVTQERIVNELWNRPGLSPRERAIVTVSTLVSRNAPNAYPHYFNKALDCGLRPAELSELLTHLAFYASFPYTFGAIAVLGKIFVERGISTEQLPGTSQSGQTSSEASVELSAHLLNLGAQTGGALAYFTAELLAADIWQRPGISPRERVLASLASLAAQGQTEALTPYVSYAKDLHVSQDELNEMLAHTAFYAGWGNATQAASALSRIYG